MAREIAPPQFAAEAHGSRLGVLREMLSTLETLTNAGQRHAMAKVVVFIEGEVGRATLPVSECHRDATRKVLADLKRESSRPLPDLHAFRSRADELFELLGRPGVRISPSSSASDV